MTLIERSYKSIVRPRVFAMSRGDAELGHEWGVKQMELIQRVPGLLSVTRMLLTYDHPVLQTRVMGINFSNPFGLAAGFDKYCKVYWGAVPAMGWGFVEVGGITPLRQDGNPRPRMWRSEKHGALCNAMGFNNPGKNGAHRELLKHRSPIPLFLNVGKGKDTPLEKAAEDYIEVIKKLWVFVDAITINISSPNTKNLRGLQALQFLMNLLARVQGANREMAALYNMPLRKMGIKVSPDERHEQLADMVLAAIQNGLDYIISVNTTTARTPELADAGFPSDRGGVSGPPLRKQARHVLDTLYKMVNRRMVLISVGAIDGADELYYRITHGADLCQALNALPFEGLDFPKRTLKGLVRRLKRDGFKNVGQAVGAAVR